MNNIEDIKKAINGRPSYILDVKDHFSVLLPLLEINEQLHILFQVRSHQLQHQPGEICFPGGRIEVNESPMETALRETSEELNISTEIIEIFGGLDTLVTPFNSMIYSYCGLLKNIRLENINFNPQEVHSLFTVPLNHLIEQRPLIRDVAMTFQPKGDFPYHLLDNGDSYQWKSGNYPVIFYNYNNYVIWGITAKLLHSFITIIKDKPL